MKYKILAVALATVATCVSAADVPEPQPVIETSATVASPASADIARPVAQAPVSRVLPASTTLSLASDSEITSKKVEVGDKFLFTVVSDVIENGVVVIPRGAKAQGSIKWKTGRAIGGKSGKFDMNFDSVSVGGRNYSLRGTHRQEGRGNTVGALLGSIWISGRSAVMIPGQAVNAFTAEPIPY